MKTLTTVLACIALTLSAAYCQGLNKGNGAGQSVASSSIVWDTLGTAGMLNVIGFGADSTGTNSSVTAINNAILSANKTYRDVVGATKQIYIPPGTYKIDGPINMKSGVTIQSPTQSIFQAIAGYSGVIVNFERLAGALPLKDAHWNGGILRSTTFGVDTNFIGVRFQSDGSVGDTGAVLRCSAEHFQVYEALKGVYFRPGDNGWTNENWIGDIDFRNCQKNIVMQLGSGYSYCDGNYGYNLRGQASARTIRGIDSIAGKDNYFTGLQWWDWGNFNAIGTVFTSGSQGNTVSGFGTGWKFINTGSNNKLEDDGVTRTPLTIGLQSTSNLGALLYLRKRGTSTDWQSAVKSGDYLGWREDQGYVTPAGSYYPGFLEFTKCEEDWTATNMGVQHSWQTIANGSATPATRIKISYAGNVNIGGTADAATTLAIQGTLGVSGVFTGNASIRGTSAFTTNGLRKAIYIVGTSASDIVIVSLLLANATVDVPVAGDLLGALCKTDSIIVTRASAGTSGRGFNWWLIR
jgi:hypothetical protein